MELIYVLKGMKLYVRKQSEIPLKESCRMSGTALLIPGILKVCRDHRRCYEVL